MRPVNFKKIEIQKNKVIINQEKAGLEYLIPLGLLVTVFIVLPILIAFAFYDSELESSDIIGILISMAIFWSIGIYILKQYLWGRFGKEILQLESNHIIYESDYKFFKGPRHIIDTRKAKFQGLTLKGKYVLDFEEEDSEFQTVIALSKEELKLISEILNEKYGFK